MPSSLMENNVVAKASLDHDLGRDAQGDLLPEGRSLVYWMAEHDTWPTDAIGIHSANPVGVDYMCGMITRYGPYERDRHRRAFFDATVRQRMSSTGSTIEQGRERTTWDAYAVVLTRTAPQLARSAHPASATGGLARGRDDRPAQEARAGLAHRFAAFQVARWATASG